MFSHVTTYHLIGLAVTKAVSHDRPMEGSKALMINSSQKSITSHSILSPTRELILGLTFLVVTCGFQSAGCTGGTDSGSVTDASDSSLQDSEVEVRAITLASGLVVDVRGPSTALDELPETATGEQLCEDFPISLTATFDASGTPMHYAATASWHELVGVETLPPIPPPIEAVAGYIQPIFPNYDIPGVGRFGGVSSNPIAVFPVALAEMPGTLPQVLAVFHHDTGVPMAIFNHGAEGPYMAFPSTWQPASSLTDSPSMPIWARYIEGQETLDQCNGHSEAIASIMDLSVVEDLATCGVIMAWPYSLPDPNIGSENGTECVTPSAGFGVTLSPVLRNPWGALACPRPADSEIEYVCFGQAGT